MSEQIMSEQVIKSDLITELSTEEQELLSGGRWICTNWRWRPWRPWQPYGPGGYGGGGGGD